MKLQWMNKSMKINYLLQLFFLLLSIKINEIISFICVNFWFKLLMRYLLLCSSNFRFDFVIVFFSKVELKTFFFGRKFNQYQSKRDEKK